MCTNSEATTKETILLSKFGKTGPSTIQTSWQHQPEDEEHMSKLNFKDVPEHVIGDNVKHVRDGVTTLGKIQDVKLDASRNQVLYEILCNNNKSIVTTKEFIKSPDDAEVAVFPQTTEDYMRQCTHVNKDGLRNIIKPKALNSKQEEWLLWHNRLNHMTCRQMKRLVEQKILLQSLKT